MNVIDRQRMTEIRKEAYLILSKVSERTDKEGKTTEYFDGGVSNLVYDSLMSVVGTWGLYEYDIVVKRTEDKPYHAVYHGTEKLGLQTSLHSIQKQSKHFDGRRAFMERYNIDKLHPVTSYKMILAKQPFFVKWIRNLEHGIWTN